MSIFILRWPHRLVLGQVKARSFIRISHVGGKNLSARAALHCSQGVGRKLGGMWSRHHTWWSYLLGPISDSHSKMFNAVIWGWEESERKREEGWEGESKRESFHSLCYSPEA